MKYFNIIKLAVLAIGLATGAAHAATVDFEVGAGTTATATRTGCVGPCFANILADASGSIGTVFTLDEGETSGWFDFFTLTVASRFGIGAGSYDVDAALAFSDPGGSGAGAGNGVFGILGGIAGGTLDWDNSFFNVGLPNGTAYTVELEDGFAIVAGQTATVRARVTLDLAPVPLPASALLLLAGIGGIGVLRHRRKEQVAA